MNQAEYKSDRQKYCLECAVVIPRTAEICPRCDKPQAITVTRKIRKTKSSDISRERMVAGVIALIFGSFGAHRFYLGHWRIGVLLVMFSWTAIPFFWGIYEGIKILHATDKEFVKTYLR